MALGLKNSSKYKRYGWIPQTPWLYELKVESSKPLQLETFNPEVLFDLPGYGIRRDTCGDFFYIGHEHVNNKVHFIRKMKSCHRKECPVCWPDWQKREALAIQERIADYQILHNRKPVHYVVSPPQSAKFETKDQFRILRSRAYEIGKLRGIKGGVMIFHTRAMRYSNPNAYRYTHCSDGPHFHIIGDGWLSNVKEFYLEDGWIVKNLRIRYNSVTYKTAFYILEHAAIGHGYPANSQSSLASLATETWFGSMSYNKMPKAKIRGSGIIFCPICKQEIPSNEWYVLDWIGSGDPPKTDSGESENSKNGFLFGRSITSWYDYN